MKKLRRSELDALVKYHADNLICRYGIKNAYALAHGLKMRLKKIKQDRKNGN